MNLRDLKQPVSTAAFRHAKRQEVAAILAAALVRNHGNTSAETAVDYYQQVYALLRGAPGDEG